MDTVNLSKSFTDMPTLKRLVPYGNVVVNSRREHEPGNGKKGSRCDSKKVVKRRLEESPDDR